MLIYHYDANNTDNKTLKIYLYVIFNGNKKRNFWRNWSPQDSSLKEPPPLKAYSPFQDRFSSHNAQDEGFRVNRYFHH